MTDKIRIGYAGVKPSDWGMRGFTYCRDDELVVEDGVEIVAAADVNEELLAKAKDKFNIQQTFTDYREMLEKADLDAVIILLPTFLHREATIDCLEAGVSVLCEKPPTSTYDEMLEVAEVARRSPGKYMFIRQSRFSPRVQKTRQLVAEGKLGDVYCAEAKWIRSRGGQIRGNAWRSDLERGGGVMLDLGVHGIDQAWFAMGTPKPVEATAATFSAFKHFASDPDTYTADDTFSGMIRFENGAVMQCLFAFGMNAVGAERPGDEEKPYEREWAVSRLYGTEAGIDINRGLLIDGPVDRVNVQPLETEEGFALDMILQAREFVRAIREDDTPLNSLDHALMLMHMLSGLRESGEKGRSVMLNHEGSK